MLTLVSFFKWLGFRYLNMVMSLLRCSCKLSIPQIQKSNYNNGYFLYSFIKLYRTALQYTSTELVLCDFSGLLLLSTHQRKKFKSEIMKNCCRIVLNFLVNHDCFCFVVFPGAGLNCWVCLNFSLYYFTTDRLHQMVQLFITN